MALNMKFSRLPLRQLPYGSPILRTTPRLAHIPTTLTAPNPIQQTQTRRQSSSSESMPKIAQSSVWTAMIPRFILDRASKRRDPKTKTDSPKSKEWNPASFYIIIFILIGSQAIRMIALKNDYAAYSRSTDAKIELLREVIERVKRGEKVDVEKLLGTGDAAKEREWEEVLHEIEQEDSLWHKKSARESSEQAQQEQKAQEEVSAPKESVIPAEGGTNKEPPKDGQSRRKLNFF